MSLSYQDILATVQSDFNAMDQMIFGKVSSKVRLVMAVSEHVISSGGKRMRPLMCLLVARMLNDQPSEAAMRLAAITEMLHTATLVHDDVIDDSSMRRGAKTANANWDNPTAVLVGDYLIARAFNLLVEFENFALLKLFSDGTCDIAEGEVLQLQHKHDPNTKEEDYLKIILGKTSRLFMLATEGSCLLFNQTQHQQSLKDFAMHFGNAFQIIDDVLDYQSDAQTLGKNIGDDISEGKPTLPMIRALEQTKATNPKAHEALIKAVRSGTVPSIDTVIETVLATDALDYCISRAKEEGALALEALEQLPKNKYQHALEELTKLSLNRLS